MKVVTEKHWIFCVPDMPCQGWYVADEENQPAAGPFAKIADARRAMSRLETEAEAKKLCR